MKLKKDLSFIVKSVRVIRFVKFVQEYKYSKNFDTGDSRYIVPPQYQSRFDKYQKEYEKSYEFNADDKHYAMSFHSQEKALKRAIMALGIKKLVNIISAKLFDNIAEKLLTNYNIETNIKEVPPEDNMLQNALGAIFLFGGLLLGLSFFGVYAQVIGLIIYAVLFTLNYRYKTFWIKTLFSKEKKEFLEKYMRVKDFLDIDIKIVKIFIYNKDNKLTVQGILMGDAIQLMPDSMSIRGRKKKKFLLNLLTIVDTELFQVSPS